MAERADGPDAAAKSGAARLRRFLRARPLVAAVAAALVFAALAGLRGAGLLQPLELAAYDRFVRAREPLPVEESPVVIVRIREEDIGRFGHPLSDALLARALENLLAAEPRAIGVDLYRDAPVPRRPEGGIDSTPDYERLAETVTRTDRVVLIHKFSGGAAEGTRPPPWLEGTGQVAFSDMPVDPGGIVRRGLLFLWEGDTAHLSLGLQLAARYLAADGVGIESDPDQPDHVRIGPTTVSPFHRHDGAYVGADDGGYQFLLDYRLGGGSFPGWSLAEVLDGAVPAEALRDKIVIVGTTAPSVKDEFYTPFSGASDQQASMYGVDLHAHAVSQLVRFGRGEGRPLRVPSDAVETAWILLWSAFGALLGLWLRSPLWGAAAALGGLAALVLGAQALFEAGWWIPVVPPALAGVASAGLVTAYGVALERSERREVTNLFSRFLRPQVAEEIWRRREQFMRGDQPWRPRSQWVTITTLMLDLQGYTAASEKTDPYVLMDWVNEFTNAMAQLVEDHGGVVDDYAGDGVKASFGFPVPSDGDQIDADAVHAVCCALAMGRKMEQLNEGWEQRGLPIGRLRIGITTGRAVVGVLGGDRSLKYTSVGDTVNAAARLESFDKDSFAADANTSWRILISAETRQRLDASFRCADLGAHALKGKQEPVHIYRILGREQSDADTRRESDDA
jgi:adenylate cyclase